MEADISTVEDPKAKATKRKMILIHNNGMPVRYDYHGRSRSEFRAYERQLKRKFRKEQMKLNKDS